MLYEISLYKVTTIIQRNLSGISSISQEVTLIASKGFSMCPSYENTDSKNKLRFLRDEGYSENSIRFGK